MLNILTMIKCSECEKEIKPKVNRIRCSIRVKNNSMSGCGTQTIGQFHIDCFKKRVGDKIWKKMTERTHLKEFLTD